ncbi:MAG TPA: Ig-like domain repeat protein [Nocardioides sp.]|uniref:Ig-like domain repeat protein n=1 Tax=Nocardioides sp. TaxID=35761 RepID=UPI002ED86140
MAVAPEKEKDMQETCARRGVVAGTALAVGLAGLTIGQGAAHAGPPLPTAQAGPVASWGPGIPGFSDPPQPSPEQASQAFTKVVANGAVAAIGLTADGQVEQFGDNTEIGGVNVPADELAGKTVVDIAGDAVGFGGGMAVTSTGDVVTWSSGNENWATDMPEASELQGSTAAAVTQDGNLAAVVKQDGSVLVWGNPTGGDFGQKTPPALTTATAVFFNGSNSVYALKSDGTLAAWGRNEAGETNLPAVTTDTTDELDVVDVASAGGGSAVALLSDGTLTAWGGQTADGQVNDPPAATDGKEIVALAGNTTVYFAVDSTGTVHAWGQGIGDMDPAFATLPDGVDPANITGLSANDYYAMAIEATFGFIAKPTISGTAKVGQTLTATPATFTDTPDAEPTGQWYRGSGEEAVAIDGATEPTYEPTVDDLGEVITYRSTATRGEATATATSDPTAEVAKADSTTTVSAPATTYGKGATVTVAVTGADSGNVTLSGAGAAQTTAVSAGKATFTLPNTLPAGSYTLTASYAGSAAVAASQDTAKLSVARAAAGKPALRVIKKPTRKKAGKATISVATAAGLAKASGKVTVTLKLGKKTKRAAGTLSNGVVTVKLPKLPKKGKWKATAVYSGDGNYLPGTSATVTVKVK